MRLAQRVAVERGHAAREARAAPRGGGEEGEPTEVGTWWGYIIDTLAMRLSLPRVKVEKMLFLVFMNIWDWGSKRNCLGTTWSALGMGLRGRPYAFLESMSRLAGWAMALC